MIDKHGFYKLINLFKDVIIPVVRIPTPQGARCSHTPHQEMKETYKESLDR